MPTEIPFSGAPKEALSITLSGRRLRIRSSYENLIGQWVLDIWDDSGDERVPLVRGVVVAMGVDILGPYVLGIGGIFAEPMERPRDEAKIGELGQRMRLVHYTEAELEAL